MTYLGTPGQAHNYTIPTIDSNTALSVAVGYIANLQRAARSQAVTAGSQQASFTATASLGYNSFQAN